MTLLTSSAVIWTAWIGNLILPSFKLLTALAPTWSTALLQYTTPSSCASGHATGPLVLRATMHSQPASWVITTGWPQTGMLSCGSLTTCIPLWLLGLFWSLSGCWPHGGGS